MIGKDTAKKKEPSDILFGSALPRKRKISPILLGCTLPRKKKSFVRIAKPDGKKENINLESNIELIELGKK